MPSWITELAPSPVSTHLFLEYFDASWRVLDASWDRRLSPLFPVNQLGDSMSVAVPILERWSLERSQRYADVMGDRGTSITITRHLSFFRTANAWLDEVRRTNFRLAA